LRAIRSLVEFLREDAPEPFDEGTESYLDRIEIRASLAEQLIDDLLNYARAGEARDKPSLVHPERLIDDILDTVSRPDGIEAVVEIDCGPIYVEATPLATCVRNLVDNAFKHHDNPPGVVSIAVRQGLKIVEIAVSDDGPGFPSSQREAIFEPFRKMHARPEVEGSGIGLSVIKRSVEAHGGAISVESEVGSGSTFTLRWPVAALDLVEGPAHDAHTDTTSETEHIPTILR
jgi:signal transduction histidine kinase